MEEMWLARDKDNNLYLYNFKPHKVDEDWWGPIDLANTMPIDNRKFPEVKWSDEEPTKVKLVIANREEIKNLLNKDGKL